MVNIKFVGFQEQVEISKTLELLDFKEEISFRLNREQVFSLICEPAQLSKWFYRVISIDSRPGGKARFLTDASEEAEAICTSFTLGEEITLLSETFGEFSARIVNSHDDLKLQVRFKKLTDNASEMTEIFKTFIQNLREISSL